jgi:hypothetical protein
LHTGCYLAQARRFTTHRPLPDAPDRVVPKQRQSYQNSLKDQGEYQSGKKRSLKYKCAMVKYKLFFLTAIYGII